MFAPARKHNANKRAIETLFTHINYLYLQENFVVKNQQNKQSNKKLSIITHILYCGHKEEWNNDKVKTELNKMTNTSFIYLRGEHSYIEVGFHFSNCNTMVDSRQRLDIRR